jgi:hypothetical protein
MELIVKTKSHPKTERYQDGDIIETFTDVQIANCHAQIICHPRKFSMNTFGLRDRNTLLEKYRAAVSEFKFTRLNSNDVERLNLITGEVDIINSTANSKGEAMDVYQFLSRRLKSPRHRIFGTSQGNEVWYTGNRKITRDVCDSCWNDIETHTDNLKVNHEHFPFSETEKRHFLPLNCCGFMNEECCEVSYGTCGERKSGVLKEEVFEEEPVLDNGEPNYQTIQIAKRQWQVPYWDLTSELGIDVDDVRNRNKELDARVDGPLENRSKMDDINVDKVAEGIVTI